METLRKPTSANSYPITLSGTIRLPTCFRCEWRGHEEPCPLLIHPQRLCLPTFSVMWRRTQSTTYHNCQFLVLLLHLLMSLCLFLRVFLVVHLCIVSECLIGFALITGRTGGRPLEVSWPHQAKPPGVITYVAHPATVVSAQGERPPPRLMQAHCSDMFPETYAIFPPE